MTNTHYGVVMFSGDPAGEHPDLDLRGRGPQLELIACGPEDFCWTALTEWTKRHPLRQWEHVEVVARSPEMVRQHVVDTPGPRRSPH